MVNFIVVTHGEFGAYMIEAAESIVGRQETGVRAVSLSPRWSVAEIRQKLERAVKELSGPDGLVVFVDMPGGTPGNLTFPIVKDRPGVELIGGLNLYMLVSAFSSRSGMPLSALTGRSCWAGSPFSRPTSCWSPRGPPRRIPSR
jgi:PTS system mannose-specific IIA component